MSCLTEVSFCIVVISKYVFVGCQEEAYVKQVSGNGMQVCLETAERLSLCLSLRAISQPLVERLEAVSSASDNTVEDIVFRAKMLLTPATRSDNTLSRDHVSE